MEIPRAVLAMSLFAAGRVRIEQLRAVDLNDPRRHARKLETWADEGTMSEVLDAIGAVFGI